MEHVPKVLYNINILMEKVPFGKSGLDLSEIGLGMAVLRSSGYINLGHGDDLNHDYRIASMMDHAPQ